MVKHFSSTMKNRKNHNAMLDKHRCFPTNQLEQDRDGTKIISPCKLIKLALIIKIGAKECCRKFKLHNFPTEDEWRTVTEFEGMLRETSRLTEICQNENKLNGACGPVMRKSLHDRSHRDTMLLINIENGLVIRT